MNPWSWFRRSRLDDLADEIRSHIAEKTDELVASGRSRADAERAARRAFGNGDLVRETAREVWRLELMLGDLLAFCARRSRLVGRSASGFHCT
jgi:hypothetical protein